MASVVSKVLTILWLILCHLSAAQRLCTLKDGKIVSVPEKCCVMSQDIYKEKWHTLSQFPMKIVLDDLEISEVTRIQERVNNTIFHFGKAGGQDISDAVYQHFGSTLCHTETGMRLQDLLSRDIRHLSNCGTGIIFKNIELGNDVEYLNICQCIQPLSINSSKLREIMMPDVICREAEQDYCELSEFHCNNRRCIPRSWRCDGLDDCGDSSDEEKCEIGNVRCGSSYFQCNNGNCTSNTSVCNEFPDCFDGSDESDCTGDRDYCIERGEFRCEFTGKCIDKRHLCDGVSYCNDGSDERNCRDRDYCTERAEFRCEITGKCISLGFQCDGINHCEDGSDERNCTDKNGCSSRKLYRCEETGVCVGYHLLCDGADNCEDRSDEKYCNDRDYCIERGHFRCEINGRCVETLYLCDGYNDCEDGSDERNCTDRDYCTERGHFRCEINGRCVETLYLCDGFKDCEDGSDERNCTDKDVCSSRNMYRCEETWACVGYHLLCDGADDCEDRSDEIYCNAGNHCELKQEARCGDGQCIPRYYLCDNRYDCSDGSDEYNCTEMSVHAPNLKKINSGFKTLMMINYSEATQKSVENLEIHNSKIFIELVIVKIKNFHELKHLDFSYSEILSAPLIIVTGILIQSVEILNLTHCEINNLDIIPLNVFPNLKVLDLHDNKIKIIKSDTFLFMQNIMKLNMSMSFHIESIILYFNTSSNKMHNLDLSNNRLNEVEIHFSGEVNVTDLSNNRLKYSTLKIISDVESSINYLDLRGNKIKLRGQFENLKGVNTVDIQDYSLDCADCETLQKPSLQKALRNKIDTRVIYNNMDNIPRCTSPDLYAGEMFDNVNICDENSNWVNIIIAAAVIIVLLILVMSVIGYKYRFEISYWIHYVKLKKRKLASCYCDADGYEYDAFISYCAADRRWVWTVLRPGLEESLEKYHLCLHERDFLLGSKIKDNIDNSMEVSRYCIMILSNYFIESQWCRFELEHAGYKLIEEKREFLIIIELEPLDMTNVPSHLKQLIETRTYLEWNLEKFTEEALLDRLKRALGTSILQKNKQSQEELDYVDTTL